MTGLGTPTRRLEDGPLVTGSGSFIADLIESDTLHCAFVRRPIAQRTFSPPSLDDALEMPGVVTAFRGAHFEIFGDVGAYPSTGSRIPLLTAFVSQSLYEIEHLEARTVIAVTNKASPGPYRGAGRPEGAIAMDASRPLGVTSLGFPLTAGRVGEAINSARNSSKGGKPPDRATSIPRGGKEWGDDG